MSERDELVYDPKVAQNPTHGLIFAAIVAIFLLGGIAGGLFYAWEVSPVVEQDIRPDQLRTDEQLDYIAGIGLEYAATSDDDRVYSQLLEVNPDVDPYQFAADAVCEMQQRGRIKTSTDIEVVRQLIAFFSTQSSVNVACDIAVFATSSAPSLPTSTPNPITPTIAAATPIFTKTPAPPDSVPTALPDTNPQPTLPTGEYSIITANSFCNPNVSGIIEIRVRRANFGDGIAGVPIEVLWSSPTGQNSQTFFTGLKPDRDAGYADFQMEQGFTYRVRLRDLSSFTDPLEAVPCDDAGTLRSYQIIFQSQ